MNLIIEDINETAVLEFMAWRYEAPYHIYNMSQPGQMDFTEALTYFLNPEYEFHLLNNETGDLLGFFSFGSDAQVPGGNYVPSAIDIGMAIRPDYTGRGLGVHFAETAVSFAVQKYAPPLLRVTIAEFNLRAQKVWRKLGFEKVDWFMATSSKRPFVIMTKTPNA
ncbi:MAG: GNAT family N-acetyltransferase [Chloroflexota bacterium]